MNPGSTPLKADDLTTRPKEAVPAKQHKGGVVVRGLPSRAGDGGVPTCSLQPNHTSDLHMGAPVADRLVGLVVRRPPSRAEDPRFESRLRQIFFKVKSFQ